MYDGIIYKRVIIGEWGGEDEELWGKILLLFLANL